MTPPATIADAPGTRLATVLYGSHAHGTAMPTSDEDWRGVYQLPTDDFLGLGRPKETWEAKPDVVYWEVGHFIRLLLGGNPNLVGQLFVPADVVHETSPAWDALVAMRRLFVSTSMVTAYLGWIRRESRTAVLTPKRLSHLVRLAFELDSAVHTGDIDIRPSNACRDIIMDVKRGFWQREEVEDYVGQLLAIHDYTRFPAPPHEKAQSLLLAIRHGEYDA